MIRSVLYHCATAAGNDMTIDKNDYARFDFISFYFIYEFRHSDNLTYCSFLSKAENDEMIASVDTFLR
jgi:hypothetical protein